MWEALAADTGARIAELLEDEGRAADFSVRFDGMLFDYSKTAMSREARALLLSILRSHHVEDRRDAMFAGEAINETEGRAVLHTALRNLGGGSVEVEGRDVMPDVLNTLARMERDSLMARAPHPDDRRAQIVRLTEAARALETAAIGAAADVNQAVIEGLPSAERELFLSMLGRIVMAMRGRDTKAEP